MRQSNLLSVEPQAFQGASSLRLLDLCYNRLSTLERSVFPASEALQTLLIGQNPLVCDCRLRWLLERTPPLLYGDVQPECSSPAPLAGKFLRDLVEPQISRYVICTKPRVVSMATYPAQAEEGQRAWLYCSADGAPKPSVSWLTPHRRYITTKSTEEWWSTLMARWSSAWQSLRIAACTCVWHQTQRAMPLCPSLLLLKARESGIEPFTPTAAFCLTPTTTVP